MTSDGYRPGNAVTGGGETTSIENDLAMLITRLEQVIQTETDALENHQRYDIVAISRKKSNMLLELTRASRVWRSRGDNYDLRQRITALRSALGRNERALQMHLEAARQLTDVIAGVARDAESDGTYAAAGAYSQ